MSYKFLIDTNLPIDTQTCFDQESLHAVLRKFDIAVEGTADLPP